MTAHLPRRRRQPPHQLRVKEIAVHNRVVFQHTALMRIIQQCVQDGREMAGGAGFVVAPHLNGPPTHVRIQLQDLQQGVHGPHPILGRNELALHRVIHQLIN